MTTKHTPGPWTHYELDKFSVARTFFARWRVGTPQFCIAGAALSGDSRIDEANARLIAAAPELLSALQALHDAAGKDSKTKTAAYVAARAAIAKATQA